MGKWRRNKSLKRRWERNHLIRKYGFKCFYDDLPFKTMKDVTIDHYVPASKGGIDELENYRLAHKECNQMKGNMTPEEFANYQKGGAQVE